MRGVCGQEEQGHGDHGRAEDRKVRGIENPPLPPAGTGLVLWSRRVGTFDRLVPAEPATRNRGESCSQAVVLWPLGFGAACLVFASYLLAGGLGGPVDFGGLQPEGGQVVADGDDRPALAGAGVHAQFLQQTCDLLARGAVGEALGDITIVWLGVGDRRVFGDRRTPVPSGLGGAATLVTRRRALATSRRISPIGRVSIVRLERQQAVEQR